MSCAKTTGANALAISWMMTSLSSEGGTMDAPTVSLADEIHNDIVDEIERRKHQHFEGQSALVKNLNHRWLLNGSAGFALKWFDEISEEHPDATREELAKLLEDRIGVERAAHSSQWFTVSHLKGVLAIVKGTYEEANYG
jgi:hypothetical protein